MLLIRAHWGVLEVNKKEEKSMAQATCNLNPLLVPFVSSSYKVNDKSTLCNEDGSNIAIRMSTLTYSNVTDKEVLMALMKAGAHDIDELLDE